MKSEHTSCVKRIHGSISKGTEHECSQLRQYHLSITLIHVYMLKFKS